MLALDVRQAEASRALLGLHPVFTAAACAALAVIHEATATMSRSELERDNGLGADGTSTMWIDAAVEEAIVDACAPYGVNILSEEIGFIDHGSCLTLVVDPIDGTANAAADIPLACFSAVLADDGRFTESATIWLATGQGWAGTADGRVRSPGRWGTTGRTSLDGAAVSLLRPHPRNRDGWWRVTERAARIRILSCTTLEGALVLQGSTDAFADAGSDTHRLMDIAAAAVLLPTVGGAVIDVLGRPVEFDVDLTRRWSGIIAATPALAEEIAAAVRGD